MTLRDNILQELSALNSSLAKAPRQNTYTVPEGYFEGLASQLIQRIRAMESNDPTVELVALSPFVSGLPKRIPYLVPAGYFETLKERLELALQMDPVSIQLKDAGKQLPYEVPAGYFDNLAERMLHAVKTDAKQNSSEETALISPLLGQLRNQTPYQVPAGYFETLPGEIAAKEIATEARVIAITRRGWFRYAAAAVVTGVIFLLGFLIAGNRNGNEVAEGKLFARTITDIKKLNDSQKDDLIDFLNAGLSGTETAQVNTDNKSTEIQQLLQDVSDEELKDFQEQSEDVREVLMTN